MNTKRATDNPVASQEMSDNGMTDAQNKPERTATRSWKIPSLVRALMVLCVIGIVSGTGWYSWQWWHRYQREAERKLFTEVAQNQTGRPWRNVEYIGTIRAEKRQSMPIERGFLASKHRDGEWHIYLQRRQFDWYIFISHERFVMTPDEEIKTTLDLLPSIVDAGFSILRFPPPPLMYRSSESTNHEIPSVVIRKNDWHYVMDFVLKVQETQTIEGTGAKLIRTSFKPGCKPDPRFDFGKLVE